MITYSSEELTKSLEGGGSFIYLLGIKLERQTFYNKEIHENFMYRAFGKRSKIFCKGLIQIVGENLELVVKYQRQFRAIG